jgi:hypothetical protein
MSFFCFRPQFINGLRYSPLLSRTLRGFWSATQEVFRSRTHCWPLQSILFDLGISMGWTGTSFKCHRSPYLSNMKEMRWQVRQNFAPHFDKHMYNKKRYNEDERLVKLHDLSKCGTLVWRIWISRSCLSGPRRRTIAPWERCRPLPSPSPLPLPQGCRPGWTSRIAHAHNPSRGSPLKYTFLVSEYPKTVKLE